MKRARRIILSALVSFVLPSCGDDEKPHGLGGAQGPVVLVIDDGFDTTNPVLQEAMLAGFTMRCRETAEIPVSATDDFATRRRKVLQSIENSRDACSLKAGIAPKAPLLQDVADLKERWNDAIANDKPLNVPFSMDELGRLEKAINRDLRAKPFHGTATAGVIAGAGSGVKMVLVERILGSAEEFESTFECIPQQGLDEAAELFNDPEFRSAFKAMPLSRIEKDFKKLVADYGIEIVNESFGLVPTPALEELLKAKGCPAVDLVPYAKAAAEIDRLREQAHPAPNVFTVMAAGNEGVEINNSTDYSACGATGVQVLVGSYKKLGQRSRFSNFGDCVEVFAQGEAVIGPIPGGWHIDLAGTSFSAPLVTRWLATLNRGTALAPSARRDQLLSLRNEARDLPPEFSPPELTYAPPSTQRSLTTHALAAMMLNQLSRRPFALRVGGSPWSGVTLPLGLHHK